MSFGLHGDDGTQLKVDSSNNAARAILYGADGSPLVLANGSGQTTRAVPGVPVVGLRRNIARVLRTDHLGTVQTDRGGVHLIDGYEGTTANTWLWTQSNTTFTQAQTAGLLTFNSGSSTASGGASQITSNRRLPRYPGKPLVQRWRERILWRVNAVVEWVFGTPSGVVAETVDSAFLRIASNGDVVLGAKFASTTEVTSASLGNAASLFNDSTVYDIEFFLMDDAIRCVIVSTDGATVVDARYELPAGAAAPVSLSHVPVSHRLYTVGVTSPAAQCILSGFSAETIGLDLGRDAPMIAAAMGRGHLNPTTFATPMNWTNSAAPGSASLSNTTAGYTNIGGQWQFAAVAGAETDYALFGFTVPAPYTLFVSGVRISTFNLGAAVATTPTLLQWGLGANGSTANLSSGSHQRHPVGSQVLAVGTPIGGKADEDLVWSRRVPLVTEAGRVFVVILKMPTSTATASQIVRGVVDVDYWTE